MLHIYNLIISGVNSSCTDISNTGLLHLQSQNYYISNTHSVIPY
ncbi:RLORF11 [Gallid alphaherpesvirus 2]|nr:RLORF11 [Gallid alphaherpesvirus 2]ARE59125.1 RLORF11 [Gallid alphaherpesvirus 2]